MNLTKSSLLEWIKVGICNIFSSYLYIYMDIDEPQKQFEDTFKLLRVTFCTFGFYALKNTRIPAVVTHFASSGSIAALKSNSWNKSTKLWMAALMKSFKICLVFTPSSSYLLLFGLIPSCSDPRCHVWRILFVFTHLAGPNPGQESGPVQRPSSLWV